MSRMKASFSHCQLSLFEGRLARIHVGEIADARNAVFCRTEGVPEDGWGSLSGGRFRNTFV